MYTNSHVAILIATIVRGHIAFGSHLDDFYLKFD